MQAVPYRADLVQDQKDLYQFLLTCQEKSVTQAHPAIASISLPIDPVDPLVVLQQWAQADHPHFYFEHPATQEAIAAVGATTSLATAGTRRFAQVQRFVDDTLKRLVIAPIRGASAAIPQFFCSFAFFAEERADLSAFPAAIAVLPQWQIARRGDQTLLTTHREIHPYLNLPRLMLEIEQQVQQVQQMNRTVLHLPEAWRSPIRPAPQRGGHSFQHRVLRALEAIHRQQFDKVVLAHALDVEAALPFDWIRALDSLRRLHPDCYVFCTSNDQGQQFIGASPERLLSIRDRLLATDALAGSAPRGCTLAEDTQLAQRLMHSTKERHEHQVVVDFMTHQLQQLGMIPQFAATPGLLHLATIQHLHTPIQAVVSPSLNPLSVVAKLHPTPAVAGLPRDTACQHIRQSEPFERSLYAAPIGWIDAEGNAEFIVAIRSALIQGDRARLYAGAGIVAGSDPDREQAEVQLKLQTLLQALV